MNASRNVENELAVLKDMAPRQLRARYAELYGEPSRSGNKQWLIRRCAWRIQALAAGSLGELRVTNPVAPHFFNRLRVRGEAGARSEKVPGDVTYTHQLRAFVEHVRGGAPMTSDARDAVANMRVIDAVYERAGLPIRGT